MSKQLTIQPTHSHPASSGDQPVSGMALRVGRGIVFQHLGTSEVIRVSAFPVSFIRPTAAPREPYFYISS